MRDTVPASWLRADSCQPAKSLTSTTAEALISASASLPFFSFRRCAAALVSVAVMSAAALQRERHFGRHRADLDGAHRAGELVAGGGLHRHSPEQALQGRMLGQAFLLRAQEVAVFGLQRVPGREQAARGVGQPRAAAAGAAGGGFEQRLVGQVAGAFQQQPRALVAQARGGGGAVDRAGALQGVEQREEARIQPAGQAQLGAEQRAVGGRAFMASAPRS